MSLSPTGCDGIKEQLVVIYCNNGAICKTCKIQGLSSGTASNIKNPGIIRERRKIQPCFLCCFLTPRPRRCSRLKI